MRSFFARQRLPVSTQGPSWGYLKSQFSRDLVNSWRQMPTKWLQDRTNGSKTAPGIPPHRAFCGHALMLPGGMQEGEGSLQPRSRAKLEHIERLYALSPESQGQNLALTVLHVLYLALTALSVLHLASTVLYGPSQVTTFLVNYKGRPYMVALKDSKLLLYTSAVERIWQIYDGRDQNMALSFR